MFATGESLFVLTLYCKKPSSIRLSDFKFDTDLIVHSTFQSETLGLILENNPSVNGEFTDKDILVA